MKPEDVQAIELVFTGWVFGVLSCLLYAGIANYVKNVRRNRSEKRLLDAGIDPLVIITMRE